MPVFLDQSFFDNTLSEWLTALMTAGGVFVLLFALYRFALVKMKAVFSKIRFHNADLVLEALEKTKLSIMAIVAVYIGSRGLVLPGGIANILHGLFIVALFLQIGLWASNILNGWTQRYREKQIKTNPAAVTTLGAVRMIALPVIWSCVLLLILDNLGFNITTLVAGLGIGGVAIALAAQNILGDLFASLSIVMDKTFLVGDFIILENYMGTVEYIGMKSTRIRSLSGEQIVFSNADLLGSRIRNYGRMFERRVEVNLGVIYETDREKLKIIPGIIKDAIERQDNTRFDRAHFKSYGNFSIDFQYIYYVLSPEYNVYMDIQQEINLYIHEKFEEEGIEFAYPTQKLFVEFSPKNMEDVSDVIQIGNGQDNKLSITAAHKPRKQSE